MRRPLRYRKPAEPIPGEARRSLRDVVAEGGQRLRFGVLSATFLPYGAFLFLSEGETSPAPYLFGLGMCWLVANILVEAARKAAGALRGG